MRDSRKDQAYWLISMKEKADEIAYLKSALVRALENREDRAGMNAYSLVISNFELALMRYSAGDDISSISHQFRLAINESFSNYILDHPPGEELAMLVMDSHEINRLFSLFVLSCPTVEESRKFVAAYQSYISVGKTESDKICNLFSEYLVSEVVLPKGETIRWQRAYGPLWAAIMPETSVEERPIHLTEFINGWYEEMNSKSAAQSGRLKQKYNSYAGYWCFEAAAGVFVAKINDVTFRDNIYYPKDWLDWARTQKV